MTAFLASTRDLAEAKIAVATGANWIDMKEPRTGALGAVEPCEVARVVRWLRGADHDIPVSATIGDCWEEPACMAERVGLLAETGVPYVKIGVYAARPSVSLLHAITACCAHAPRIIVVCFAEASPDATAIATWATTGIHGMMLDTAHKAGGSLTDILAHAQLGDFVVNVQAQGLLCGLAGSLAVDDVARLLPLGADYLGFRGALCEVGGRSGSVSARAVRTIRACLDNAHARIVEHQTMEGRPDGMA
ncbi:MAG: (5-formylfuran-3-yl)methyl phosphate synthase [Gammaproteobacteria bacterium]|jgi:dihydroneopterin aldolase